MAYLHELFNIEYEGYYGRVMFLVLWALPSPNCKSFGWPIEVLIPLALRVSRNRLVPTSTRCRPEKRAYDTIKGVDTKNSSLAYVYWGSLSPCGYIVGQV